MPSFVEKARQVCTRTKSSMGRGNKPRKNAGSNPRSRGPGMRIAAYQVKREGHRYCGGNGPTLPNYQQHDIILYLRTGILPCLPQEKTTNNKRRETSP